MSRRDTGRPPRTWKRRDDCPRCGRKDVAWWEWKNQPYRHNRPDGSRCV